LRSVLQISPTTNYQLASPAERSDQMESLARVLMGLSHSLQLVSQARPLDVAYDWPKPPQIERRWLAVVTADDEDTLTWRTRTLKSSLEGVGFRCAQVLTEIECLPIAAVGRDCIFDGTHWYASLVLRRWPREVAPGWLGQALAGDLPVDCAIHIQPQDAQRIARFLKKQQAWQSDEGKASPDAGNTLGRMDAETVRLKLIAHTDKPCKVAVVLTVRAETRVQLKQRVSTLGHEIGLTLGDVREATFEHDRGKEATDPNGICRVLGAWRTLDCTSVASTGLFQPATIMHLNGADIGVTHEGAMLVRLDPFDESLRSFGGLITGSVGSGKSYLLKLLLRRLKGVEIRIVEHSDPPEYDGVPGLQTYSVAKISEADQAAKLREYITDLWALARRDPRPRLLVIDELWSVLKRPELAKLIEEVARRGRKYGLALWIATQQVEELLDSGKAVFDNAAVRIYLQQENRDLEGLCKAAHLSEPARRLLRGAARGQALFDCGRMVVLVDVQASPREHHLISTDPRETWASNGSMLGTKEVRHALDDENGDGSDSRDEPLRGRADRARHRRRVAGAVAVADQ
jgi:type II secretory pathway predicted ATPase ExeA